MNAQLNPFKEFPLTLKQHFSDSTISDLEKRWNEKHRYFHGINHLNTVIHEISINIWFKDLSIFDKSALLIAAFFHDAIYDPRKKDNEDQSIKYFLHSFKQTTTSDKLLGIKVCSLINVTKYRKRPTNLLEKIFWDADNSGFKKGYDHLLQTDKLIAKEYLPFYSRKDFIEGKIKFLESNIGLFGVSADKDIRKLINYWNNELKLLKI